MRVAGRWLPITLTGPSRVEVDGEIFNVPHASVVKIVRAGRLSFAHVKVGRSVFVLCSRLGQLDEPQEERWARATPDAWRAIVGESVKVQN